MFPGRDGRAILIYTRGRNPVNGSLPEPAVGGPYAFSSTPSAFNPAPPTPGEAFINIPRGSITHLMNNHIFPRDLDSFLLNKLPGSENVHEADTAQ